MTCMNRNIVLILLVFSQFACVTLWFLPNAILTLDDSIFNADDALAGLTSVVQFGFIAGTLFFAFLNLPDRFSPSFVFFVSAVVASALNLFLLQDTLAIEYVYGIRAMTGFCLAGIYPVGMKIAADYFDQDISHALGFLLGALVVGTAFPHLLYSGIMQLEWNEVIIATSALALAGGVLVLSCIPNGPFRKRGKGFHPSVLFNMFTRIHFRKAAFGYFGHMWELYAFWAFVPVILAAFLKEYQISGWSFFIIAIGSIACILGGYWAKVAGSYRVARFALVASGLCCLMSPLIFQTSLYLVLPFLLFWGGVVIMDSPQFSSLISLHAPAESRGSALTLINCIGFSITIVSIMVLGKLADIIPVEWLFVCLLPGPVLGVAGMYRKGKQADAG